MIYVHNLNVACNFAFDIVEKVICIYKLVIYGRGFQKSGFGVLEINGLNQWSTEPGAKCQTEYRTESGSVHHWVEHKLDKVFLHFSAVCRAFGMLHF